MSAVRWKLRRQHAKDIRLGDRVRLVGNHPWAGQEGTYVENRPGVRLRRVVLLDNGEEAFVTHADQWERALRVA